MHLRDRERRLAAMRAYYHARHRRRTTRYVEPLREASETDLAWAAGIIDGEGSITIQRASAGHAAIPYLSLWNSSEIMVREIVRFLGGAMYVTGPNRRKPVIVKSRRHLWRWYVSGRAALAALLLVRPYLRTKTSQAELALTFPLWRGPGRLPQEMRERRGVLAEAISALNRGEVMRGGTQGLEPLQVQEGGSLP